VDIYSSYAPHLLISKPARLGGKRIYVRMEKPNIDQLGRASDWGKKKQKPTTLRHGEGLGYPQGRAAQSSQSATESPGSRLTESSYADQ